MSENDDIKNAGLVVIGCAILLYRAGLLAVFGFVAYHFLMKVW